MNTVKVTEIPRRYLDVRNACAYTSLSRRTLDYAKDDGDLPFYKVGKKVLLSVEYLDEWLAFRRVDVRIVCPGRRSRSDTFRSLAADGMPV